MSTQINIVSGFLGVGKTTLLKKSFHTFRAQPLY
ncbi:GTP-binding protein [Sporotomaculum syntrophicum]